MYYRLSLMVLCSFLFLNLTACQTPPPPQWRWQRAEAGLPRQATIVTLASDPTHPNLLWLGYYGPGGLAMSQDGGRTWRVSAAGSDDNPIFDLLFIPSPGETEDVLWAASRAGLLRSVDAGLNWQPVAQGLPSATAFALAVDASGRLYVGLDDGGIYAQLPDGGWISLTPEEPLASAAILSLAVSADGRQLYAGTSGRGVFASRDAGRSWTATYPESYVPNLALNPTHPLEAVASLRDRLVRTGDGGQSWHTLPLPWARDEIASLLWLADGTLGAGTGRGRLYRSLDGGDSWLEGGAGLPAAGVLDLALTGSGRLLAATWTGAYASDNGGETWAYLTPSLGVPNAQTLLTTNDGLLLGTRTGLFGWQPDTRRWRPVPADFPTGGVTSLAMAPSDPQILYAGSSGDGLYRSDDGGAGWRRAPSLGVGIPELAVNPVDADNVHILAAWERTYESRDGGQSWQARWEGLGTTTESVSLAVDPVDPFTLYLGSETGLYRTRNNEVWRRVGLALADQTVLTLLAQPIPDGGSVLYIGATRGVYRSLDGGDTIQPGPGESGWGRGLEAKSVTALLADPEQAGRLYAGTAYAGVYQSLDWGQTWQPIGPAELTNDVVEAMAWGAQGELFVATLNGVWVGEQP